MPERHIEAARHVLEHFAKTIDAPFSVRLWDGTTVPLGRGAASGPSIVIAGPGVLGALFRRPTLDHLFRRYVSGDIYLEGGDLIGFVEAARRRKKETRIGLADLRKGFPWTRVLPLLLARDRPAQIRHEFQGGDVPRRSGIGQNKDFIQFHYDLGNEFYSCFSTPRCILLRLLHRLEQLPGAGPARQARHDLPQAAPRSPARRLLDIGCGWGGLDLPRGAALRRRRPTA